MTRRRVTEEPSKKKPNQQRNKCAMTCGGACASRGNPDVSNDLVEWLFIPSCSHQPRIFSCVLGRENSIFPLPPAMVMVLPVRVPSKFRRVIFAAVPALLLLLLLGMIFIGIHKEDRLLHQLSGT